MTTPVSELRELSERAAEGPWFIRARPTDDGLSVIEDGRQHAMFPVTGEAHDIAFIVAAINHFRNNLDRIEAMEASREVIAEANNSLYGSQGFFLSANGGEPDKYHLARPIEKLKERANQQWRRAEALEAQNAALREALSRVRAAMAHVPVRSHAEIVSAVRADNGLSLRACAAKHAVGVSVVRGIRARAALTPTTQPMEDNRG